MRIYTFTCLLPNTKGKIKLMASNITEAEVQLFRIVKDISNWTVS